MIWMCLQAQRRPDYWQDAEQLIADFQPTRSLIDVMYLIAVHAIRDTAMLQVVSRKPQTVPDDIMQTFLSDPVGHLEQVGLAFQGEVLIWQEPLLDRMIDSPLAFMADSIFDLDYWNKILWFSLLPLLPSEGAGVLEDRWGSGTGFQVGDWPDWTDMDRRQQGRYHPMSDLFSVNIQESVWTAYEADARQWLRRAAVHWLLATPDERIASDQIWCQHEGEKLRDLGLELTVHESSAIRLHISFAANATTTTLPFPKAFMRSRLGTRALPGVSRPKRLHEDRNVIVIDLEAETASPEKTTSSDP